jgi:protoporphyrinogen oxidase
MSKIVIIGAGLTGLSTAYHLEKRKFNNFKIFEKENESGGLCRSVKQDGFTFDYTGHLLHINDPYFEKFIKETINIKNMNSIVRRSFIYSHGKFTNYPFQINLKGLDPEIIADCIEGYIKRKPCKKQNKSFYDWALENFGIAIAKNFFIPFQNKIFDHDIKKITSTWTGRFVPKTSLRQMIIGAIKDPENSVGYNSNFYYPKKDGINSWITNIKKKIKTEIKINHEVAKINIKNKEILFTNGHVENYDHLVTTMPLDILLEKIEKDSSSGLKNAKKHLLCNSVVNFNLGISRNISDKHWIYFPENQFPFYRIGFPHNFSNNMAPQNCSSLYGEFSYLNKSKIDITQKLKESLKQTKKLLDLQENEILTEKTINISHAYVIYDFWRERNLPKILTMLEKYDIHSIGRYGQWKYSSMQEAILDGKSITKKILIEPAKIDYNVKQEIIKMQEI